MIVTGVLFLVAVLSTSCKSQKVCPAYGSLEEGQASELVAYH